MSVDTRTPASTAGRTASDDGLDGRFVFPASFGQQRLWFLNELNGESGGAYVVHGVIRMVGDLDRRILQQSVDGIVARHEALRTGFAVRDGEPVQVVAPELRPAVAVLDFAELPADERERELLRLAQREVRRAFDLRQPPLLRVTLVRLDEREHVLLVTLHHIVSDGWSGSVFVRELAAHYEALAAGREPELPQLPVQYADFAVWQREFLQGPELERQLEYWRAQLAEAPVLQLPTDRPRPKLQSFRGATRTSEIPEPLVSRLEELARAENATLYMTLLAAFELLLARLSGQTDLSVGTPVAGRTRPELEPLIGFFLNNLVLRTDLSGDPTFLEALGRVRETCLDAYAHQDVPFERLVEELQPARDLSRSPLFQAMFVLRNEPMPVLEFPGMQLEPLELDPGTSKFDLTMILTPRDGGLQVQLEHVTDLFDAETIDRLLERFRIVLKAVAANPSVRLSELEVLGPGELDLLETWGRGPSAAAPTTCLPALVDEQAERTPDAVALACGDTELSYRDLVERANRLAHELRALGVGRESLVGVCLERRPELLVALLAVLKAGGAYVPIDPAYPADRIEYMLSDSGAKVVLTQESLLGELPETGAQAVAVDREWERIAERPAETLEPLAGPDDLAYVIYTSGSTGRPKGVMVPNGPLVNFLESMRREPGLEEGDVLAAVTTLSFDIAGLELYLPLVVGGRVVLVSREEASNGELLAQRLASSGATAMQATPATWQLLLDAGWKPERPFKVLCGGEALAPDLAQRLVETGAAVWNLYGPTETTIWSSRARLDEGGAERTVPLGRALSSTQLYVLDDALRMAPIGAEGELYIGGAGVTRGYLGRPSLTAERFVPDPFSPHPGRRLYRTGDLVRFRSDGTLEFIGRVDHQVKVRGFRIELGEIESALREHDAVREAVVLAREDVPGDKRLVAYVVPTGGDADAATLERELRELTRARLPEYMLPAAFVVASEFPRTPNGKIDRKALPAPDGARPELGSEYVEPETPLQQELARIFAQALGVERVGLRDDFFELGGHSLLAARLLGEVREAFDVELQLQSLFLKPTVENVASIVEQSKQGGHGDADERKLEALLEGLSDDEVDALLNDPLMALAAEEGER
jgi:amino acid adenylation domain-containing protein